MSSHSSANSFAEFARRVGWEGLALGLTGLGGLAYGVLDFFGFVDLSVDESASLVLAASGILLMAMVAQSSQRAAELAELKKALETVEVRSLHMKHEFPNELAQRVALAQSYVLDTNLNAEVPRFTGTSPQEEYKKRLAKKVRSGQLAFRDVVCIFRRDQLLGIIDELVDFSGTDYYIRHLDPPPRAIPIIHLMSFDDEHFFLGGFYSAEASNQETVAYVRHPDLGALFKEYWSVLWNKATPLNSGRIIDWQELARVGSRLGMLEAEFAEVQADAEKRLKAKAAV